MAFDDHNKLSGSSFLMSIQGTTTDRQGMGYTYSTSSTDIPSHTFNGYVAWYWVALGLVVPVLLGTLFCVLDYLRRKKGGSSKHTEQRLESMCERNSYVPPKYEEIISNSQIVIEPVPGIDIADTHIHGQTTHMRNLPIFTIQTENSSNHEYAMSVAPHLPTEVKSTQFMSAASLDLDNFSINSSTMNAGDADSLQGDLQSYTSSHNPSVFEDIDLTDAAPPSYEEYHKYELYGSRAELV